MGMNGRDTGTIGQDATVSCYNKVDQAATMLDAAHTAGIVRQMISIPGLVIQSLVQNKNREMTLARITVSYMHTYERVRNQGRSKWLSLMADTCTATSSRGRNYSQRMVVNHPKAKRNMSEIPYLDLNIRNRPITMMNYRRQKRVMNRKTTKKAIDLESLLSLARQTQVKVNITSVNIITEELLSTAEEGGPPNGVREHGWHTR